MKISEKDIGRRVVVNGCTSCQRFKDEPGIIISTNSNFISVSFDKPRDLFHSCLGTTTKNHGFNVYDHMITFTDEENKMDFQAGDKVQCLLNGDGIVELCDYGNGYPILVRFLDESLISYSEEGLYECSDNIPSLYHAGSIKREGSRIVIDPVKPVREKWVNVYLDNDGRPFFGDLCLSKEEAYTRISEGSDFSYITTIQLKRS